MPDLSQQAQIIKTEGLKSLLSLLDNESGLVVESALHVLANLMAGDPEARVMVVVSVMRWVKCDGHTTTSHNHVLTIIC
jgi:hypothetical protein